MKNFRLRTKNQNILGTKNKLLISDIEEIDNKFYAKYKGENIEVEFIQKLNGYWRVKN